MATESNTGEVTTLKDRLQNFEEAVCMHEAAVGLREFAKELEDKAREVCPDEFRAPPGSYLHVTTPVGELQVYGYRSSANNWRQPLSPDDPLYQRVTTSNGAFLGTHMSRDEFTGEIWIQASDSLALGEEVLPVEEAYIVYDGLMDISLVPAH